jgi:adenylate cyclase
VTFRSIKEHGGTPKAFEREFALEILKSDKLRVTILIGVILSALLIVLIVALLGLEQFQRSFHGNFRGFITTFITLMGVTLVCLVVEGVVIDHLSRKQAHPSLLIQYLSSFIETSIPTLVMMIGSLFLGPIYALFTPVTLLYPVFIVLSALRLNARLCVFTGAVAAIEYSTLALYFVDQTSNATVEPILASMPHHVIRGLLLLVMGVVTGLVTIQIKKRTLNSFATLEERNRIRRTFGEYVSPVVMEKLLTLKPDLASEHRSVCVMFLDIRNFSTFAEKRTPEAVVAYLESLFEFMIEIVNRHHGIINKFLGDGFMAVFGAPVSNGTDCLNGVEAAREIILRVEREVAAGNVLPTRVGIGLHAGEAVTGSIGSALRKEYAVIGDVVNVASRIEQLNKEFGSQLLISEPVWQAVSDKFGDATPIGAVQVKGREAPIQLWQVA